MDLSSLERGNDMPYSKTGTQRIPLTDEQKREIEWEDICDEVDEQLQDELEEDFDVEFGG